jgi:N-acetylglutamate synthase
MDLSMNFKALLPLIEAAAVRGWPARDATEVDGWLWRHTSGGSIRANSAAALAYSGSDLDASIDRVEALAQERGVPPCFAISDVSVPASLDARLAARGYIRGADHVTMAKRVEPTVAFPDAVDAAPQPSPGWLNAYLSGLSEDRRAVAPEILMRLPATALYVSARTQGRDISSGLTISDGSVASVQCMATLPNAQRQGGARRVLQAIEHSAAQRGQSTLYLQTGDDNDTAKALYVSAGFSVIGRYHTRTQVRVLEK